MPTDTFSRACEAERAALVRMASRHLGSRHEAEEVVAEAIARAHESAALDEAGIGAWLNVVTRRLCADVGREQARWPKKVAYETRRQHDNTEDFERVVDQAEADWLFTKIASLPHRQREALILKARGHSVAEVAQELGVPYRVADGLLQRARATMRAVLAAAAAAVAGVVAVGKKTQAAPIVTISASSVVLLFSLGTAAGQQLAPPPSPQVPSHTTMPSPSEADLPSHIRSPLSLPPEEPPPVAPEEATVQEPRDAVGLGRPSPVPIPHERSSTRLEHDLVVVEDEGASREHDDEDFVNSLKRCLENGPVASPEHIGCR
jgi:RNA polymerase sigma factor (sigma-70 family)